MKILTTIGKIVIVVQIIMLTVVSVFAQAQQAQQKGSTEYDIQHYRIEADIVPAQQLLKSRAEIKLIPEVDTRTLIFELNGSLTVKKITRVDGSAVLSTQTSGVQVLKPVGKPADTSTQKPAKGGAELQFIQDNRENMNVRIDLGSVVPAGQTVVLNFEYEGALDSPQGGPISNARLAYVGNTGSYLFYAARWFPFHDYAADRATYNISIKVPKGEVVAGYSDVPVVSSPFVDSKTKEEFVTYTFSSSKPVLPGNFASSKYIVKSFNRGGFVVDFFVKPGDEKYVDFSAEVVAKHLEYYSAKFGPYAYGNKLIIAETDDDTLGTYSGPGIIFVSPQALTTGIEEKLSRETSYQWWGLTVGLNSFDDVWLSQGLGQFSTLLYVRDNGNETLFKQALQAELEKALAFEQSASIRQAPLQLDDQSPAFRSVIIDKGALVFVMLRQLIGEDKFDKMLATYYKKFSGKKVKIDEFEAFASKEAGRDLRFFFGQWIDSTGVPEFRAEYRILRTKDGFRVPGTIKQDLDTFEMPVEVILKTEAGNEREVLQLKGTSADFNFTTKSKPVDVVIDPDAKIIRTSDDLKQGVIVRRGIEHFREMEYVEAEQQFQAAIKLNRSNSWAWYNLGILYIAQRNWKKGLDAFDQSLSGSLRPDWIEVFSHIYRGNCWDMLDQRERAVAEYKKALDTGNNYDNAQAIAQGYLAEPYGKKTKTASSGT